MISSVVGGCNSKFGDSAELLMLGEDRMLSCGIVLAASGVLAYMSASTPRPRLATGMVA